jgi:hypothetical protein
MAETAGVAGSPSVKRYALVPNDISGGLRRFHLARVASPDHVPDASRLERMEEVAAKERRSGEARHLGQPGVD